MINEQLAMIAVIVLRARQKARGTHAKADSESGATLLQSSAAKECARL